MDSWSNFAATHYDGIAGNEDRGGLRMKRSATDPIKTGNKKGEQAANRVRKV